MTLASAIGEATTVISFVVFLAVVWFAYGKGRARHFDEAARAPFALPDETEPRAGTRPVPGPEVRP
jgi:cytochrome c oxidase cbb3-type subunit 4